MESIKDVIHNVGRVKLDRYTNDDGVVEKSGYSILEYRMDDKEMQELCEANGYTFKENGIMDNI